MESSVGNGIGVAHLARASFAQERIWRSDSGASDRDLQLGFRFTGGLDTTALHRALDELVARHEILRTTLEVRGGELTQVVTEPAAVPLPEQDATEMAEPDVALAGIAEEQLACGFAPADLPLRAVLVGTGKREHVLLVTLARSVADPASLRILHRDMTTVYLQGGVGDILPPLSIQYADYADWQREQFAGTERERQAGVSRKQLTDCDSRPFGEKAMDGVPPRPACSHHDLPRELMTELMAFGRHNNTPLSMVLLAAFSRELFEFTRQQELVICSPLDGRTHTETENLIGNFDVPVPLRLTAPGESSFRESLDAVSAKIVTAYDNQTFSVEQALTDPAIGFRFVDLDCEPVALPDTRIEPLPAAFGPSGAAVTLTVFRESGGFRGVWAYDERVITATEVARLHDGFGRQLAAVVGQPETVSVAAAVSAAWNDILQCAEVNATDDFFDLGGHSLAATRLARRLQSELGVRLTVRLVFDNPALGDFTAAVAERIAGTAQIR